MKIEIARNSGYCFGVNRAMELAENHLEIHEDQKVYSIGSIIHNDQAMSKLIENGLIIEENIEKIEKKTFAIIRSHGLPKSIYDRMEEKEISIVDATCPFVRKIQNIAFEGSKNGNHIILLGDKTHPEVIGICGWVQGEYTVINSEDEALAFRSSNTDYIVVVQTTFKLELYQAIEKILKKKLNHAEFHNTICYATKERQESVEILSKKVDAMIVVGGKKSSNTIKLAEISRKNCPTFLIETIDDLNIEKIKQFEYLGLVAGASTPNFIVEEVQNYIVNKINI